MPALPVVDGNSLFWFMAALIAGEFVVIYKLGGALYRSRRPQVPALAGEGFAATPPEGRSRRMVPPAAELDREGLEARPRRRKRGRGKVLALLAALAAVLILAGKAGLANPHVAAPAGTAGPVPTSSPKPAPKVSVKAPAPAPAGHPLPTVRVPQPAAHAVSHFPLTGGELTAVLIIAVLVIGALGINYVRTRRR